MQRSVMVVGGAGYIGSHAVRALVRAGRDVVVLDNLSTGHAAAVSGAELINADIRDTETVYDVIKRQGVGAVMHFAADSRVGESQLNPEQYYDNNVGGALSLLKAMRRADVDKLVFSSTAAVYGEADGLITEQTEKRPSNVYGRTKWMIEQILADFDMAYGMRYVALRYFNAAGADAEGGSATTTRPATAPVCAITSMSTISRQRTCWRWMRWRPEARAGPTTSETARVLPCWRSYRQSNASPA